MTKVQLTKNELHRYSRHLLLNEVGLEGQKKLKQSSVLLIGAGGLGSPVAIYLAAAGIGKIGLVEHDSVDLSNLQRQILYSSNNIGRSKIEVAKERINELNDNVDIEIHPVVLDSSNAIEIFSGYDIIIDSTDNFETRYLSNDASYFLDKPLVSASIFKFEGQVAVFNKSVSSPCYRCLYPEPPQPGLVPNCAEGGVLGILPGVVGTLQASEVIKLILDSGEILDRKLLHIDVLGLEFQLLEVIKNPNCDLCGVNPTITELVDYIQFCGYNTQPQQIPSITVKHLLDHITQKRPFQLIDVRSKIERETTSIRNSIHIAQNEIDNNLELIATDIPVIIHCKSGKRSASVVSRLLDEGFSNIFNLEGGIDEYRRYNANVSQFSILKTSE